MSEATEAIATAPGWSLLGQGRWEEARESFEGALRGAETPTALEGLSWAAWWLDDEQTVFATRERSYRLYEAGGDAASAARMATWLAIDELDFHGAVAVAGGWLARARRLLEPIEPGPDHGWVAFMEGYIAHGNGDGEQAARLGAEAAELGRRCGAPDLEMLGLALEGSTLVARARVDDGMQRLDEAAATAVAGGAAIPISGAWTCCFLVSACAAARDYERAFAWCDRIAEFADRYGSRYMLAFCRAEYAAVHLWRGHWADAETLLEASIGDFAHSRPAMAGAPTAALAELRRRQGRVADAERLLAAAGPSAAAHLCTVRLALDRGDALQAEELAERLLRQLPAHNRLARASGLELLVHALVRRGDPQAARAAAEEFREIAALVGTPALLASADLAAGVAAGAGGRHDEARRLVEDAVDAFGRCEAPYEMAQAKLELAGILASLGRTEDAAREAAAALEPLLALGAAPDAERARRLAGPDAPAAPRGTGVTRREREVLALLAEGLTNRQIAERLVVSEHTVHRHVTNILRKLGLPSRTAAAAHAVHEGLVRRPAE